MKLKNKILEVENYCLYLLQNLKNPVAVWLLTYTSCMEPGFAVDKEPSLTIV